MRAPASKGLYKAVPMRIRYPHSDPLNDLVQKSRDYMNLRIFHSAKSKERKCTAASLHGLHGLLDLLVASVRLRLSLCTDLSLVLVQVGLVASFEEVILHAAKQQHSKAMTELTHLVRNGCVSTEPAEGLFCN